MNPVGWFLLAVAVVAAVGFALGAVAFFHVIAERDTLLDYVRQQRDRAEPALDEAEPTVVEKPSGRLMSPLLEDRRAEDTAPFEPVDEPVFKGGAGKHATTELMPVVGELVGETCEAHGRPLDRCSYCAADAATRGEVDETARPPAYYYAALKGEG